MALKAGPKNKDVQPLPTINGPVEWFETVTGEELYGWQADVIRDLSLRRNGTRHRIAYVQVPRKNGKTRLAAALALLELCDVDNPRRHIYTIADSERNLNSALMWEIRDIIDRSALAASLHVYKDHIECPETGSFIMTRPSNLSASQSINPHLVLFDEIHMQRNDQVWYGMQMAGAARDDALLFGITTPGYDLTSLAHSLYTSASAGDPGMYGAIYETPHTYSVDDEDGWRLSNPCHERPHFMDTLRFDRSHLPEHEFRRFRLGQWTASEAAWFPHGVWSERGRTVSPPPKGARVWLGFDGSYSGDSTALMGCTDTGHLFVVGAWENPGRTDWRVPRWHVENAVQAAFETWDVVEMACDPPYWGSEIAAWQAAYGDRVIEFPTFTRSRMAPACTEFYAAVMDDMLTHDGDERLARHVANAIVQPSPQGDYITKADKNSPAKIDLAVAAVIAYSRYALTVQRAREPLFVG